jgi:hypothetical protein
MWKGVYLVFFLLEIISGLMVVAEMKHVWLGDFLLYTDLIVVVAGVI